VFAIAARNFGRLLTLPLVAVVIASVAVNDHSWMPSQTDWGGLTTGIKIK
jgi:hypothetical protein